MLACLPLACWLAGLLACQLSNHAVHAHPKTSWDGNAALLPTCSLLAYCLLYLLPTYLLPVCLHCEALRVNNAVAAAGRQSDVNATESCREDASEKRITLIVAWWGPGIRAEPGAPGQGPCRSAPCPKPEPYTLARTGTAQSPDPGPPRAGPILRAEASHAAPQDAPDSQVLESSSESTATSATDSGSASEFEPGAGATADCKSGSYPECPPLSALPDTESSYSELWWLQQCQLPRHEQQADVRIHQHRTPGFTGLRDSPDEVGPKQGSDGSTALLEKKMHGAISSQETCHWYPAAKGDSLPHVTLPATGVSPPGVTTPAKGYNPPTISPVWLPVNHLPDKKQCDEERTQQDDRQDNHQDDQQGYGQNDQQGDWQDSQWANQQDNQDEQRNDQQKIQQDDHRDGQPEHKGSGQEVLQVQDGSQPAAKRHKGEDKCDGRYAATYQQQLVLPLPPLRFFVRSADEISSVYQPRIPSLMPCDES